MNQEIVRRRLLQFVLDKGTTWDFICKKIGIPNSLMTAFKNGKKDFYFETLDKLDAFLRKENY